jgi:pyrroline-5-carboxylate reductase
MGGALLDGWLAGGAVDRVDVVEPGDAPVPADDRVHRHADAAGLNAALPAGTAPDAVILAVKPQMMDAVAPDHAGLVRAGAMAVSIAAGKTLGSFESLYGDGAAVVRVMPNTPAAIGRGASVLVANAAVSEAQRRLATTLMAAAGTVDWVEDEALIDVVTALSGGGPAYTFLLIEAMAAAGARAGLPEAMAMRLARRTVIGAGALAEAQAEIDAATLRRNVTSPGGTTQAALAVLMAEDGVQPLFDRAIAAATARSRELAG